MVRFRMCWWVFLLKTFRACLCGPRARERVRLNFKMYRSKRVCSLHITHTHTTTLTHTNAGKISQSFLFRLAKIAFSGSSSFLLGALIQFMLCHHSQFVNVLSRDHWATEVANETQKKWNENKRKRTWMAEFTQKTPALCLMNTTIAIKFTLFSPEKKPLCEFGERAKNPQNLLKLVTGLEMVPTIAWPSTRFILKWPPSHSDKPLNSMMAKRFAENY